MPEIRQLVQVGDVAQLEEAVAALWSFVFHCVGSLLPLPVRAAVLNFCCNSVALLAGGLQDPQDSVLGLVLIWPQCWQLTEEDILIAFHLCLQHALGRPCG